MLRPTRAIALAIVVLVPATHALAGTPKPWLSTIDPRMVLCPHGDIAFHVIPSEGTSPDVGARLVVDLCNATGWAACAGGQPASIVFLSPCQPSVLTDSNGLATFALKAGGTTTDSTVAIFVDGVPFGHFFFSSPDQNGDLVVDAQDDAILLSKLGTRDFSADFDADGVVTTADETILRAHWGHACEMPTPVVRPRWGTLKVRYR